MKIQFWIPVLCLLSFAPQIKAKALCPYEESPVCALPKRCQFTELGGEKIPFECEVGVSYKSRCGVKPEEFLYQYEGKCEKLRPKSRVQLLMKDSENCAKPLISGNRAVELAKSAGLKAPIKGAILAEYSEGSFYPDKPFPDCLWSLRVSVQDILDESRSEIKEDVYFVHSKTGEVEYQNPNRPKKKKK